MGQQRIKTTKEDFEKELEISQRKKSIKPSKIGKKFKLSRGRVYIQSTYNNTLITVTDLNGNVVAWGSAGVLGFKGPKRATPYAATEIAKYVAERIKPTGLKDIDIFVKGIGAGRESAIRTFHSQGFNISSIKDVTPIPHDGCRPPKVRRV